MTDDNIEDDIFTEEFNRVSNSHDKIMLTDVLKMSIVDENGEYKINLCHIPTLFYLDEDKDGKFTRKDFSRLAKIIEDKEKEYKRFEFSAMIQAYFTLAMWKRVCSEQGESDFVAWIKKLVINNNEKIEDESDEDTENPDPMKYVDRTNLKMLYDVLNVKTTHGIDFQSFFELMKITSDDMEEEGTANEEFVLISVLDFFCVNFIRGFSKLILDLGVDSFMETEFDYE